MSEDTQNRGMDYNSNREFLTIPEYGRNVQKLIKHAKTIEDKEFRQAFVERIVGLMQQMHPQNGNLEDYREKLWKHVFKIADYELDVDPPGGEKPTREESDRRPEGIPYPVVEAKYRHYGHNVQQLIKKALSMPEGPKREGFTQAIASYMKLAYKTWNKEHYVSDEIVKADIVSLSNGELHIAEDKNINLLTNSNRKRKRPTNNSGGGGGHKRGRGGYRRKK